MSELPSHELETLLQDDGLILSRSSAERVLIMTPASAAADVATRLEQFYSLREDLDGAWAVRPIALRHSRNLPVLIATDPGGEPLAKLLGAPLELPVFLNVAIGIASALAGFHGRGLIHRDVKPASILVQPATGAAWLCGLGRTSRTQRQRQAPEPPHVIAGTLAYMAPEQTGRMNRSIDSRSDLYSLGVLLYQLLVGELPFTALDPIELVHCHVARRPATPHERSAHIPQAVSAVVMKLLAKVAEERYQTAAGVAADLRTCLREWREHGHVPVFALGTRDASDRFLIPEKLYGREKDIQQLLAAFERVVASARPSLMLVAGYSGVGKSSVVNELHKALLPPRGLFASGKFDQYQRDVPYATLAQAFQRLVSMILVEPEPELVRYREAIRAAVDPYGQLVVNLVPELERVIGKQPAIAELAPQDAQRVFEQVLRRFIGVFARPEHPLALFLDDLQWLDAATLDLMQHLLLQDEVRSLFLVGAYRDNEVGPEHPLAQRLDAIRKAGAPISEIVLEPLALTDLQRLIADTLHDEQVTALAELVHEKTAGNPFFTIQFLTALADDGLIAFDHGAQRWSWHASRVAARSFTDNVVALMIDRIRRLPPQCRDALQIMACLGNSARVASLAAALDVGVPALHAAVAPAMHAGLVAQQAGAYSFLHDRVQEAAYASIAEAERPRLHLRVGRRLLAYALPDKLDENVFEIVGQLNRGIVLVDDQSELDRIAELNLKAGQRAKTSTAYVTALAFFCTGAALLRGDGGWLRRRALCFALAFERSECEFLTGDLEQAEARLAALVPRADGLVELAAVTCLRILLYVTRGDPARSVGVCLEYLEHDGIHFTPHPTRADVEAELERMWSALGERSIEDLACLPETTDAATLATLDVLAAAASPAWFLDQLLPALLAARMANLSIERGNGPASSFGYTMLAAKLGPFAGDYRTGYRFGTLGVELAERSASPRTLARVLFTFTMFVKPWADTLDTCHELLKRGFEAAERAGDLTYATYVLCTVGTLFLIAGAPLEDTEAACRRALAYARRLHFDFAVIAVEGQLGLTRMLRGDSARFGSFDHSELDEQAFEQSYGAVPALALPMCWYWTRRQQALFLAGEAARSVAAAEAAEPLLWVADVYVENAEHHFYGALARAECLDQADAAARPQLRERLEAHVRTLATFGQHSPVTFGSRATLAAAELARVDGRERAAMDLYEQAIRSARGAKFVHLEALGFELAARFYAARGFETIAASYRREAHAGYQRWGARGKLRQLEQLFPELREPAAISGTINAPVELLDLATVLKISQAVSGEVVFPKLLDILMRTAIEHAGATRGLLILPWREQMRVEAEATIADDAVVVRLREGEGSLSAELPESIVRYVMRTRTSAIIDDAVAPNPFSSDRYVKLGRARAVACLPLIEQSRVTGALYLENELAPQTFTVTRVAVLKLLASQAAISIENTRLYANVEEREAKIRRLVDANIIGIFIWDASGSISDANDAFLRMLDRDRSELGAQQLRWPDLIAPEWQALVRGTVTELEETGTVQPYELEFARRDGRRVPVLVGVAAFAGSDSAGVAFVLDLTEQKRAEHRLRRSEAYLTEAQRLTHTGSWSYDVARQQLGHVSEQLRRLFGVDAVTPRRSLTQFRQRIHAGDRARVLRTMISAIAAKTDFEVDFRALAPGESAPKHIHCLGHPVFDVSGELVEFVGTVMDVTERWRADEQRERLRQAEADLAHVTRVTTMGELAASLAHEIKQPLMGALTNAALCRRLLEREFPDLEAVRKAASRLIRDVQRASDILVRIGSLFKKEALPHEPVDLNEIIEEMTVILRSEANRYSVSIRTELDPELPRIMADRVQLQQVVLNLFVNAIEAMKESEGPREITVTAQPRGEQVQVSVSDLGGGLPEHDATKIFDAFFTTKREGTGMGLSISRSIVAAHGGHLSARNNAERGATFELTLPSFSVPVGGSRSEGRRA